MLRQWICIVLIVAVPSYALAQVQSGTRSGRQSGISSGQQSGVPSGYYNYPGSGPTYSSCWRTTVVRGTRIVWNCQPYPPP